MPHDLDAEHALLGAALLSPRGVEVLAEHVTPADFFKPVNGHVAEAILDLFLRGDPVDVGTVASQLRRAGLFDQVGGTVALAELVDATPSQSAAPTYARTVADFAKLRALITAGGEIVEIGYTGANDVGGALDRAEQIVFNVADATTEDTVVSAVDALARMRADLENPVDPGTPTGLYDLDEIINGARPGELLVVGARPAMGKTAFALGVTAHAVLELGVPSLYFSLEMSAEELMQRLVSSEARVDATKLRRKDLDARDWDKINQASARIEASQLFIDDNPALTLTALRAKTRRIKARHHNLGLVVVDYMQLMSARPGAESRQIEVAEISRGLKVLARELDVPVIALSQLSRSLESRQDKRPMLSDLRDSGSVEQDADTVVFLYRDEIYDAQTASPGEIELIVSKARHGSTGTARAAFLAHYTRIANMARAQQWVPPGMRRSRNNDAGDAANTEYAATAPSAEMDSF